MTNVWTLAAASFVLLASSVLADTWDDADAEIERLTPSVFSQLPSRVVSELQRLGCTIPQPGPETHISRPANVIRGEFAKKGQVDWAVLCSRGRVSAIHIFWGGPSRCDTPVRETEDKTYLQGFVKGIGYSRLIHPITRNRGSMPPKDLDHHAVEDAFLGKASGVIYCDNGKWTHLTGAD